MAVAGPERALEPKPSEAGTGRQPDTDGKMLPNNLLQKVQLVTSKTFELTRNPWPPNA